SLVAGTTYYWNVAAANSAGSSVSATWSFSTASATPPASGLSILTASPLPAGTVGIPYSGALDASGGTGTYQWTITAGSLPSGISLASFGGVLSGLLEGVPQIPGTFTFTVNVTDS